MRTVQNPVVLCGDLNMLRCFDGTGVRLVVASPVANNPLFYSRHARARHLMADPRTEPQAALGDLLALGASLPANAVLYYGDDAMLLLISRNRQVLSRYYHFLLPDVELVEDMANKIRFASLADRLGMPVPRTVLSCDVSSADEAMERVGLPCVLKPNSHVGWFHSPLVLSESGMPCKVLRADTPSEMRRLFQRMREAVGSFVMQQYIPGGDDCIYSFHAYLDQHSRLLAQHVGRKIRTYPRDSGMSTYLQMAKDPEVVSLSLQILRQLNFVGVVKFDYKRDPRTGRLYLLEINPRFSLWNHLAAASGINFPLMAYNDLLGRRSPTVSGYRTDIRWLAFGDDIRSFVKNYHRDGVMTWRQYLTSFRGTTVHDVFSWRDPGPLIRIAWQDVAARARRLGAAIWRHVCRHRRNGSLSTTVASNSHFSRAALAKGGAR